MAAKSYQPKMSTKSYPSKVICGKSEFDDLRRTHRVFNAGVRKLVDTYIAMKKGAYGQTAVEIAMYLLGKKGSKGHDLMNPLTAEDAKDTLDTEGMKLVRQYRRESGILFSRYEKIYEIDGKAVCAGSAKKGDSKGKLVISSIFWHFICNQAIEYLRSNNELMQAWRDDRRKWLEEKQKFFDENAGFREFVQGYLADFDAHAEKMRQEFQTQAGQRAYLRKRNKSDSGKRFSRWHLWYEWICSHPEILEWRGRAKAADFVLLTPDEVHEVEKQFPKRQDRRTGKMLDMLRRKNPELDEIEKLRKTYTNDFARFRRPPTLTLPSADKHPCWCRLEKDKLYRKADFEKGTIELCVVCKDETDGEYDMKWRTFRLKPDPRLQPSHRAKAFAAEGRYPPYKEGKVGNTLNRPAESPDKRLAGLKGAKLILKRNDNAQIVFTVVEQNEPLKAKFSKKEGAKSSADRLEILDGKEATRVMAVDLGARHVGAYVITEGKRSSDVWRLEHLKKAFVDSPDLPDLRSITQHDWQLRKARRKRGKPVKNQRSFISLQDHRTKMSDDRFKKAANVIVENARRHSVHIIVFEDLRDLKPTAYNERWLNRQVRGMNHRHIFDFTKKMAAEFGINVTDVRAYNTSRLCSKCGFPGYRFSMKQKSPYREKAPRKGCSDFGYPVWDSGGHLFRCPHCGYRVQADLNAAANIAQRFFGSLMEWKCKDYRYSNAMHPSFDARKDFDKWASDVQRRKSMPDAPF